MFVCCSGPSLTHTRATLNVCFLVLHDLCSLLGTVTSRLVAEVVPSALNNSHDSFSHRPTHWSLPVIFLQWQVVFLMHSSSIHQIFIQHQHCVMCSSESLGRYQWVVRGRKEKPCFRVGLDLWSAQILCMRSFFSIQVMFLAPWVEKHFFSPKELHWCLVKS